MTLGRYPATWAGVVAVAAAKKRVCTGVLLLLLPSFWWNKFAGAGKQFEISSKLHASSGQYSVQFRVARLLMLLPVLLVVLWDSLRCSF